MSNQDLVDAVRNWVHFDNLSAMLTRQVMHARNMRASFEEKILGLLGNTKRLRIQGATLEPATRKNSAGLNWTNLEESLHKYYEINKKTDETDTILTFLKDNRGTKVTTFLKKTPLVEESASNTINN
jgi:hypothetical protein